MSAQTFRLKAVAAALGCALAAVGGLVHAQETDVRPSVQTRLTWTDNGGASRDSKESDWIAEVTPSLAVSRRGGRFNGNMNAQFRNTFHTNDSKGDTSYLAFQGRGELEAVEDLFYVDMGGSISRNNLSAFSGRAASDDLNTSKNDETRTWSLAPRLQFRFGDTATAKLGYMSRWYDGGNNLKGSRLGQWTGQVMDPAPQRLFGWGVDYTRSETEFDNSVNARGIQEAGRATLYINVTPQFRLRAIAGHESNDYGAGNKQSGAIYGGGFDWEASERSRLSATIEDRVFGTGYNFSFDHRTARTQWRLSYMRDVTSTVQSFSSEPLIEAQCRAIADSGMEWNGWQLDPDVMYALCMANLGASSAQNVVSNAYFLQRSLRGSVTLLGERNSLTLSVTRSQRSSLNAISGLPVGDDFALSTSIKTSAASASFSHRLTPITSLISTLTRSRTEGSSASGLETRRLLMSVGLNTEFGPKTSGGLNYRYQRAEGSGGGSDFTENAIIANLGLRF
ncbi:TIGR03016 family PEP-CTERM system-associated outer membrane protein [Azoarcus indigens]|uniref:Uncharacterized protein (PEP-CTERM system associated) n=1 Tax=Azoarcus indigens TaxID=29545 RepID=A0A4R6E7B6_9RHOO|nr:TIGR03016 family PEP-CTERM system-associated outer membrane protein [Azoarcus indigens]NMG63914.1 TIGR03016 family PEP-CTERM system-associated outer membrane protein [Azoarcus indigens]TDN53811.1 uncharacterized protein (PEP-CTERM system associated) [Azoarcus indigens]